MAGIKDGLTRQEIVNLDYIKKAHTRKEEEEEGGITDKKIIIPGIY